MAKGMYHYIRNAWKSPDPEVLRKRMIDWRAGNAVVKVEKPLRLDKARALGYKAKKGFVVVRVKLQRGGRTRSKKKKGRRSAKYTIRKNLHMSYQWVAEVRASKKYPNLEVLNSYQIGKDGIFYFFEVILVDPNRQEIINDKTINWICDPKNRHRAQRGLTGSAKRTRGLTSKSPENWARPSRNKEW
jgi:large subunit ribosomal protein L15e